jgi:hypothetical protein
MREARKVGRVVETRDPGTDYPRVARRASLVAERRKLRAQNHGRRIASLEEKVLDLVERINKLTKEPTVAE